MKIVTKDSLKAEREQAEREIKLIEEEKVKIYLESLRMNKNFQKYVIEGIIKRNIDALTDIRNIKNADFNNLEEVGKLVLQAKASRTILEKILSDILN